MPSRRAEKLLMRRRLDAKFVKAQVALAGLRSPTQGWLRTIREALGMTQLQLGQRLGIAGKNVMQTERREARGTATIESLRRLADAMDCDVVCCVVPRHTLAKYVEKHAYAAARRLMADVSHSMALEEQGVDAPEREAQIRDLAEEMIRLSESRIWNRE